MNKSSSHDFPFSWASFEKIAVRGLQKKLLYSHLSIAFVGVIMLGMALTLTFWVRFYTLRMATLRSPTAQASLRTLKGVQRSLAELRGWVALGDGSFKEGRKTVWFHEIWPTMATLQTLSRDWTNPENNKRLEEAFRILQNLEESQWWVEDVAQSPGNEPARIIFAQKVKPVAQKIVSAITKMIDVEKRLGPGKERKALLGFMADFRGAFVLCQVHLSDFLDTAKIYNATEFHLHLGIVKEQIHHITNLSDRLTRKQADLFQWIQEELLAYESFAERTLSRRKQKSWNVAQHLMTNQTVPLAKRIIRNLEAMSMNQEGLMRENASWVITVSNVAIRFLFVQIGGMVVLAAIMSRRRARQISQPIAELSLATQVLAAGRLTEDIPISPTSTDEVSELTLSFNKMRSSLQKNMAGLKESEEKIYALLEHALDGIITINEHGIIELYNRAAAQIFGYAPEEVIGKNIRLLMPSPNREQHDEYLARYFRTGEKKILGAPREVEALRKDGRLFPMELSANDVCLGEKRIFIGILRDITERKRAETELQRAKKDAEAASQAKSEFLANMSHELRTPMNGVIGMNGLLLETDLNEEQQECAELIQLSADSLLTVIEDILDFSKIEFGNLTIKPISFDLRLAAEEVVTLIAEKAANKDIELILRYSPETPHYVVGDPKRIRQALTNLTNNAIKFTQKGHVFINVETERQTEDHVTLRISVEDTGIGIPQDKLEHIFDRFTQADASDTRKYGGTGLGLTISKQLIELMGGRIGVTSGLGEGSTFWFTLPLPLGKE